MIHRQYTILQDTREKRPLLFPEWLPIRRSTFAKGNITAEINELPYCLSCGDYTLQGYEGVCIVERKGSPRELASYCLDKRDALRSQMERIAAACVYPILLIEGSPAQYLRQGHEVMDIMLRLLAEYSIPPPLWIPCGNASQRRTAGAYIARLLINFSEATKL